MGVSVRSTSKTHAKGHFAKKYYDLRASLSHTGECLKCGILRTNLKFREAESWRLV